MKLSARCIVPGQVEGEVLAGPMGISFFGGVDPDSGIVVERGHALEGRSIAGKVLVFPSGKGSTVGSYTLYRLKANGKAPLAIVNAVCETITAVGCIIAEIPCVDRVDLAALRSGQRVRIDAAAGEIEILPVGARPPEVETPGGVAALAAAVLQAEAGAPADGPLWQRPPEPLRGCEPGSFAEDTFTNRLPRIAGRVLENGGWPPQIRSRLQALIAEMPHGRLRPLDDSGAPDLDAWQAMLQPYYGQTWLAAPWLPAETYFFRRVLEATLYFQPGPGYGVDPFRADKLAGLDAAAAPLAEACRRLAGWEQTHALPETLARLLRLAVWGNQADLSVFPPGADGPSAGAVDRLLVDQSAAAAYLCARPDRPARVDLLFDNGGLELAYDLLLIDFLFEHGLAGPVVAHARPFPTYVSDVTRPDLHETLAYFSRAADAPVRRLAQRLQARLSPAGPAEAPDAALEAGRLYLTGELHWAGALPNWRMPEGLRAQLARSSLLISKGDMNYRRWLGDLHWPFTTPFEAVTAYRPAPLLALRVIKSNVLAGLPPGLEADLDRREPDWLYNGGWGVIQFAG